ncbi:prolipoprotein diacylglyceryl transferase [Gordonia sp. X0973]|uniref:prolipoprotein diacylglyceryl transferase n=1 Tax=Gordonia sp. X0973 TaxID=2742602 RepID=UPI0026573A72|nr:prolipoprotein diacylglyceryl transferase [Gordonia sp. X0973]
MKSAQVLAYIPSPPQGVWQLGPIPIRAYALCIVVGIIVALWWGSRRWIARGGQPGEVLDVAIFAVPFGLIGGRLYHVMTDWRTYFGGVDPNKHPIDALKIWEGGLGIWGAVALGALGAWIGCRVYGIKLPSFGDAIAPPILLAQAIGRLGNYFNQEVYGRPTDKPWALEIFRRLPDDMTGVSTGQRIALVHPTFLYELLWNVFFVIVLVLVDRYFRVGHGRLFALYVMGYCFGRFFIELMRDDHASEPFGMGIRVNSIVSVVVFACAFAYFLAAKKGRELGLSMYRPKKAAELEAEGKVGYIDPWARDTAVEPDVPPVEQEIAPTAPEALPAAAEPEPEPTPVEPDAEVAPAEPEAESEVTAEPETEPEAAAADPEPEVAPAESEPEPEVTSSEPAAALATTVASEDDGPVFEFDDTVRIVSVSREIEAPASEIFEIIADPAQQPRIDGNDNLDQAEAGQRVTAVGDTFAMTNTSGRVRENKIVEFTEGKRIAWMPSEVGKTPPGHLWRWECDAIDDGHTKVTHTYDWTQLDPDDTKRVERAQATGPDNLLASLNRLAALFEEKAEPAEPAVAKTPNIVRRVKPAAETAAEKAADDETDVDESGEGDAGHTSDES